MRHSQVFALLLLMAIATIAGCEPTSNTVAGNKELLTQRARLTLTEEPPDPVGIVDLRETLQEAVEAPSSESESASPWPIVLVGRIGGKSNTADRSTSDFPWEKDKAQFIMSDPSAAIEHDHGDDHGDDHHDCPFCNKKAADAQAMVQFIDDDGNPLPMDARDLFELEGEELVVVRGRAQLVGTLLMVTADGIYVRR